MKKIFYVLFIIVLMPCISNAQQINSQDTLFRVYSIDEIFNLTIQNNQTLKLGAVNHEIAKQSVEVAKDRRLPSVSTSLSAGYLGDVLLIEKDFSKSTTVPMPHFANAFAVEASQLIFNGNVINNTIASASLQEQIAALDLEENTLDMKLLVAGNYLDLYKLYNQRDVYRKNIELAELRLNQIDKLYKQGMVTRNDLIRSELQIANLNLAVEQINNNINILNKQLTTAMGVSEDIYIVPDTTILVKKPQQLAQLSIYQTEAQLNYPSIKSAKLNNEIAEKGIQIAKAERLPILSAYAGNNLQRPLTSSSPALDMYSNGWQAGLRLSFNIDALYKAPKNIRLSQLRLKQSEEYELLERQNRSVNVNAAFVKHNEAISQTQTLEQNMRLADENYRITEKKYLNQLALLIDMLDASNAKLDAELQHTNSEINILFTYYKLQKEIGEL